MNLSEFNRRMLPGNYFTQQTICNDHSIEENTALYRTLPAKWLKIAIKNKRLRLVNPSKWDDPFENYLMQCNIIGINREPINLSGMRSRFYGQCWSLKDESDAMWRIYSSDHYGVRIKTSAKMLLFSLCNYVAKNEESPELLDLKCWLGKVDYLTEEEFIEFFKNKDFAKYALSGIKLSDECDTQIIESLLIKRRSFSHEEEVRIIYYDPDDLVTGKYFEYVIDPNLLIEEITLDPRLREEEFDLLRKEFRNLGYKNKISQSKLYSFEPIEIRLYE